MKKTTKRGWCRRCEAWHDVVVFEGYMRFEVMLCPALSADRVEAVPLSETKPPPPRLAPG